MKNYLLLTFICLSGLLFGQVTLYFEDFEDAADMDGYQYYEGNNSAMSFGGGGTNYVRRDTPENLSLSSTTSNFTGKVVGAENTDNASFVGHPFLLTDQISIVGETGLRVEVKFAAPGKHFGNNPYEVEDYLKVEYKINTGIWRQALLFQGYENNASPDDKKCFYDAANNGVTGIGDDVICNEIATVYGFDIPQTGNTIQVKVSIASFGDHEEFVYDDLKVTAFAPCSDVVENDNLAGCDSVEFSNLTYYSDTVIFDTIYGVVTGGCDSVTITNIDVHTPDFNIVSIDAYLDDTLCIAPGNTPLPSASPSGGYYDGIGVVFGDHVETSILDPGEYWTFYYVDDANGCQVFDSTSFVADSCAFITKLDINFNYEMFPNPVEEQINFDDLPIHGQLMIYDLNGRLVLEEKIINSQMKINVEQFSLGTYSIEVRIGSSSSVKKFIKM